LNEIGVFFFNYLPKTPNRYLSKLFSAMLSVNQELTTENWLQIPGALKDVSINPDGSLFGVNKGQQIYVLCPALSK
jgi:hypothetical protein